MLRDVSKVVKITGRKFIEDLFVFTLWRVAILLHEVVSNAERETRHTDVPVNLFYIEREISS